MKGTTWGNTLHVQAIKNQHAAVVLDAMSGIMKETGLWNGDPKTQDAAAIEHAARFVFEELQDGEPVTRVHFNGDRMLTVFTEIDIINGCSLRTRTRVGP